MKNKWRRYEVMLPLRFNDGREIPREWFAEAFTEMVERFGAGSYETQVVEGRWLHRDSIIAMI